MISALGKIVKEAVELIGDVGVIERGGVGVMPQGGGGVGVAQAGLGLEQPPVIHQVSGHAMTEAVQGRVLDTRGLPQAGEPAGQGARCQVGLAAAATG